MGLMSGLGLGLGLVLTAVLAHPWAVWAPAADVEAQADALVQEGKLDEAFELLETAYYADDEPEPRLLFGMGIIELERNDCEAAVGYLGRFLATSPGEQAAAKAREVIAYCEGQLREQAEPATPVGSTVDSTSSSSPDQTEAERSPDPPSESTTPSPPPARVDDSVIVDEPDSPTDAPTRSDLWYRDGLGWGLLGTGIAVTAGGAGLLLQAQTDVRAAERSEDEGSFDRNLERVPTLRIVGGTLTGVGVGLLIGAAVRYGLVARRGRRSDVARRPSGPWKRTTLRF